MNLPVFVSDKLGVDHVKEFQAFIQKMASRRDQGFCRYGPADASQHYLSRLRDEIKAYGKTGNCEQLLNIAVYAFLESVAPQHDNFHHDPTAASVNRRRKRKREWILD